jgi:hypothetical protein
LEALTVKRKNTVPETSAPIDSNLPDAKAKRTKLHLFAVLAAIMAGLYLVLAYILLPMLWVTYAYHHPAIDDSPTITRTGDDHPGDPINVALVGSEEDLKHAMKAAGWVVADPLGLKNDLKIAAGTVLKESYESAPVSNLYLWNRKEDLAFEQAVGDDPRRRHHVRFWKSATLDENSTPAWMGSASYDKRVGLSYTTGQITHHIDGDVDTERNHLFETLRTKNCLASENRVEDFQKERKGKNGGGDEWFTDGALLSGVLDKASP